MEEVINVKSLGKIFADVQENTGGSVEAIRNISFRITGGEFVSIVGPSGCGKSTLLDIIGGLESASSGEVIIDGGRVTGPDPRVSMVFQLMSVFPWRTAIQNVEFGMELRGVSVKSRRARARDMIKLVGLGGFENKYPSQLSGGMNQRIAIARALALDPQILLLDEPFGSLDEQTRFFMGLELLRIWETTKKTILFVTHSISEAILLSDRVFVMSARPSSIKEEVEIKIERPRTIEALTSPTAVRVQRRIWELLRIEANKGLYGNGN